MGKDNRICFLCGEKYSYCPTCNEDVFKPTWYAMWCCDKCKDIDNILAAHTVGQITESEAREMLVGLNINLTTIKVNEHAREHLGKILGYGGEINETSIEDKALVSCDKKYNHKKHNKKQK